MLKNIVSKAILIDIDDNAVHNAYHNVVEKNISSKAIVLKCDLLSCLSDKSVEVITANPPYLSRENGTMFRDVDAGHRGIEILSRIIEQSSEKLKDNGVLYIVFSSLTGREEVFSLLRKHGFKVNREVYEHYFFEDIIAVEAVLSETS